MLAGTKTEERRESTPTLNLAGTYLDNEQLGSLLADYLVIVMAIMTATSRGGRKRMRTSSIGSAAKATSTGGEENENQDGGGPVVLVVVGVDNYAAVGVGVVGNCSRFTKAEREWSISRPTPC